MSDLHILVTNDDGVHAPGIQALAETLRKSFQVTVVAPQEEMSGVSHALTVSERIKFETIEDRVFAVAGTPADCVAFAVRKLLPEPPDLVVSGINRGANVADDVAYSGTVAGAREGAMLGLRSIAVSLATRDPDADFGNAATFTEAMIPVVAQKKDWGRRTFLNVNVPEKDIKGVRITTHGRRDPFAKMELAAEPTSRVYHWIQQGFQRSRKRGMSDIEALRAQYIAVTPLHFDFTNYHAMDEVESWGVRFGDD